MIFFGGLALILILLIWFVMTCRNNNAKMKKEREMYEEANQDEL
jgi:preprotein translocase subunit YajC